MKQIILYAVLQFLSISVSTGKYALTGTAKPFIATIINALAVLTGNVATVFLVKTDLIAGMIISFVDTLIAVPLVRWIIDKCQKDRLWIYTATIYCNKYKADLLRKAFKDRKNIHSNYQEIYPNTIYSFSIYAKTKEESKYIKTILSRLGKDCKYHIVEAK